MWATLVKCLWRVCAEALGGHEAGQRPDQTQVLEASPFETREAQVWRPGGR